MSAIKFTIKFAIGNALKGLQSLKGALGNVGNAVKSTGSAIQGMGQRSKIDLMAWGQAFQALNGVATNLFKNIISNSPSLGAAFAEVSFASDLLAMSIGEALAPVLQPLIDLLVKLIEWFTALPDPIKLFIGLVIALTVAVTALAIAVIAIQTVGAPLILIILAIVVAIAALIVVTKWLWDNWENLGQIFKENKALIIGLGIALAIFASPILIIIGLIIGVIAVIKNWGKITQWFSDLWGSFTGWIADTWENAVNKILDLWDNIKNAFGNAKNLFGNVVQGIKDFVVGIVSGIINGLISGVNGFLEQIKGAFDAVRNWDIVPQSIKDQIPNIQLIPSFKKGGIMPFTGLAQLHQGERVLNTKETDALQTLQLGGGTSGAGGQGGNQPPIINITNQIQIDGGIFTETRQIEELVDLISEKMLDRITRGISV